MISNANSRMSWRGITLNRGATTEYEVWYGEHPTSLFTVIERMKNNSIGVGLSFVAPYRGHYFFKITNYSSDDIIITEASVVF